MTSVLDLLDQPLIGFRKSGRGTTPDSLDPRMAHCLARKLEFLPDLPYESWEEVAFELQTVETETLSAEQEQLLFRQMNLAYFQASQIRESFAGEDDPADGLAEFERLVRRAERIRDELLQAFHKLNLSIAARFANSLNPFDELASEGQFTLLTAISRFDPERGFRFSTYAMHAIRRRLLRVLRQKQRQRQIAQPWSEDVVPSDGRRWTLRYEQRVARATRAVEELLPQLNTRERYILRARFGWGQEFEPRTLREVAEELGVSRERVRQLEARALRKLRSLAGADLEPLRD